jgi:hypothetical protein
MHAPGRRRASRNFSFGALANFGTEQQRPKPDPPRRPECERDAEEDIPQYRTSDTLNAAIPAMLAVESFADLVTELGW